MGIPSDKILSSADCAHGSKEETLHKDPLTNGRSKWKESRIRYSLRAAAFFVGSSLALSAGHADPVDAGPPASSDAELVSDSSSGSAPGADATTFPGKDAKTRQQIRELRDRAQMLNLAAYDRPSPAPALKGLFEVDTDDAAAVKVAMVRLTKEQSSQDEALEENDARLALATRAVESAEAELARLRKKQRRRKRLKIPAELIKLAQGGRARVDAMALERNLLAARLALTAAKLGFLKRTQPERLKSHKQKAELERRLEQERLAAELEQRKAQEVQRAAEKARAEALQEQSRAKSEAGRLLAQERARLENVRAKLARHRQAQVQRRTALTKEKAKYEIFRREITTRAEALQTGWPDTAPQHDLLHDKVVSRLRTLRPAAVKELTERLAGKSIVPVPGDRLNRTVLELDEMFQPQVRQLHQLRAKLAVTAATQKLEDDKVASERLTFIHREISWLNQRRIALLQRISEKKHAALTGLTRETFAQLSREVLQLTFDGAYWAYLRLHQLVNWRQLLRDLFAISDLVARLFQIVILLLLLSIFTRRWEGWLTNAIAASGRSSGLGSSTLRLTKLLDVVRHCGPALLALGCISATYHVLGGQRAVTEIQALYLIFFWVAIYRVQLRLVESAARYTGMEDALRAAEGEELLEAEDDLEGPPVPKAVRLAQEAARAGSETGSYIVPASVLLVRSVRAATRYILAVVLVLELTSLAVGQGTIYWITAKFSWLAALPFIFYFLQLWRPHISRAYLQYARGGDEGALERMVKQSQRRPYGVFVIGIAFTVLLFHRLTTFARRYLSSRDATKRLLSFLFRRQVARHAQQTGKVVVKRGDLPGAILREFPARPLGAEDLRLPVPELDELVELYRAWEEDRANGSAVLVGHTGMGKSTLLGQLQDRLRTPVLRHQLPTKITRPAKVVSYLAEAFSLSPKPSSEKELIKRIREDCHKVVALGDCHNLFLRHVGGFEAFECFRRVVNETCDSIFWYLGFNEAAWDFLENLSERLSYFRRVVRISPWSERQIRRLIKMRMNRALYRVSFSDLVVAKVQEEDFTSELGRTSKGYFRVLWDFTGGNPLLAGHFWLNSLVPHREHRLVQVHLFAEPRIEWLEELGDDILFVLTAITEHENLKPEELAKVTNLPIDLCNFAYRYCLEGALLERDRETERLRLSPRWQGTVIRFLKRKYLLH